MGKYFSLPFRKENKKFPAYGYIKKGLPETAVLSVFILQPYSASSGTDNFM